MGHDKIEGVGECHGSMCDSVGMPSDGLDQEAGGAYAKTGGRRVGPKGGPLTLMTR